MTWKAPKGSNRAAVSSLESNLAPNLSHCYSPLFPPCAVLASQSSLSCQLDMTCTVIRVVWAFLVVLASVGGQEKWVWNGKTAKAVKDEFGRVRYGLYDPETSDGPRRDPYQPGLRPPPPDLPPLVRPGLGEGSYPRPPPPPPGEREYPRPDQGIYPLRPGQGAYPRPDLGSYPRPGQGVYPRPDQGNYPRPGPDYNQYPRPGGGDRDYPKLPPPPRPPTPGPGGVDPDPTRFQKCKCTHAFNCKSPGLLFGSCDAGKKYCCEKSVQGGGSRDFVPDDRDPQVLAGPGGPVDHLKKPTGGRPVNSGAGGVRPATGSYGLRPDGSLGLVQSPIRPRY